MTIRSSAGKSVVDVLGVVSTTANALTSTVTMLDNYVSGTAKHSEFYRQSMEANYAALTKLAAVNAEDQAIAWLVEQRKDIVQRVENDVELFNSLKAKHFPS